MTKEINDIVNAFHVARTNGRYAALATVVHVEGSSYRMPGARMLVEDNGCITGAISGGCLEGDALRKALQAMSQGQNKLVIYDTLHEDDVDFGVQLGCNGKVYILFEPIDHAQPDNPIALLERTIGRRTNAVLVTLFSHTDPMLPQPGTCLLLNDQECESALANTILGDIIYNEATEMLTSGTAALKRYDTYGLSAFFELLQPPVSLIIAGAGNDAIPLVNMANILGWQITIIDGRASHANIKRFPSVHKIIVAKPADAVKKVTADQRTVFVLMTHNYNYDLAMMRSLLQMECRYIGSLGPKSRVERMFAELQEQGITITEEQAANIFGPTGLDIGAETPEEIALSILAEIKAVMAGHQGRSLRLRLAAIHSRPEQVLITASQGPKPA
ncbi:MAG: XdhC family protein [Bacteroidota bacterium]